MRRLLSAGLIAAGAWFVGSSGAIAAPANGAAIDQAADAAGIAESVHCRPFRHWHRWGFGRGCGPRGVIISEGVGVRHRFGVRHFRSRDVGVSVRSGERIRSVELHRRIGRR